MKKITSLFALCVIASAAQGQSYIAGLNFDSLPDVATDVAFDKGSESGLFTLNIQTGAEDNLDVFGYTDTGWAALNDIYDNGSLQFNAGQPGFAVTVESVAGVTASSSAFGGTSAFAQGFSDTAGISFGQNTDGFFTIGVAQAIDDLSISFDVFADAGQSQVAGSLLVGGESVNVTSAAVNQVVSLGNVAAGVITFDLTGLDSGATFDNFMIAGTVVPEPSTYAAIFGLVALTFSAVGRRRA